MNFESPSQCKGNVTGWRFCFYRNINLINISSENVFRSIFMVLRRQSLTSNYYSPVQESIHKKTLGNDELKNTREFMCMQENLNSEEYFAVQENDIIGACIGANGTNTPLLLVGRSSEANHLTYVTSSMSCNMFIRSKSNSLDLQKRSDLTLHLYADIGKLQDYYIICTSFISICNHSPAATTSCRVGNNPPPSDAVTTGLSGTYLNTQYPVTCGNHITKWHYCYHTEAATPGATLSMTVAVWSLHFGKKCVYCDNLVCLAHFVFYSVDTATNTYIVSPSSIKTITFNLFKL